MGEPSVLLDQFKIYTCNNYRFLLLNSYLNFINSSCSIQIITWKNYQFFFNSNLNYKKNNNKSFSTEISEYPCFQKEELAQTKLFLVHYNIKSKRFYMVGKKYFCRVYKWIKQIISVQMRINEWHGSGGQARFMKYRFISIFISFNINL